MKRNHVLNLKLKTEKFEETVTVKIIIVHIIKTLMAKHGFELIYSHGLVSGIISLSNGFNDETRKPSFILTCQIFGFEKMLLLFLSGNVCFFYQWGNEI